MAQIVTITNPLTGQPEQVDQLEHTAQQIDDGIGFESTDYPGCYYRMVSGVTEWVNPPMLLGVEYRTTERYLGKPVYAKAVDFGALPNNERKNVSIGASIAVALSCNLSFGKSGTYTYSAPFYGGADIGGISVTAHITGSNVCCVTTADYSDFTAVALCKYTKSTD